MLYLEDYLEMIEHLPIELRDRFTEMREIDLGVENTVDRSVLVGFYFSSYFPFLIVCKKDRKISSQQLST